MTEPPAKRAKRTDSSAMWDRNSPRPREDDDKAVRGENRSERDRGDRGSPDQGIGRTERDHVADHETMKNSDTRTLRAGTFAEKGICHVMAMNRIEENAGGTGVGTGAGKDTVHGEMKQNLVVRERTSGARIRSPLRSSRPNGAKPSIPDPDEKATVPSTTPPTGPRLQKPAPAPTAPKTPPAAPTSSKPNGTTGPSVPTSKAPSTTAETKVPPDAMDVDEDPETAELRKMMGFAGFRSTKQTKVPGNNVYGVRKEKKTEYRQYMNRIGGFNRPLSPSR
ncbi:MAG: hypothetical protein Q9195_006774 [Heterodermia aff. obscurata]